jgi:hypothetical protein
MEGTSCVVTRLLERLCDVGGWRIVRHGELMARQLVRMVDVLGSFWELARASTRKEEKSHREGESSVCSVCLLPLNALTAFGRANHLR